MASTFGIKGYNVQMAQVIKDGSDITWTIVKACDTREQADLIAHALNLALDENNVYHTDVRFVAFTNY